MNASILLSLSVLVQAADTIPADTYRDPGVRALVERAIDARDRKVDALESYEARLRERFYLGVTGERFRRERSLLQQERMARILWRRSGEHVVLWEGMQAAFLGNETDPDSEDFDEEVRQNREEEDVQTAIVLGSGIENLHTALYRNLSEDDEPFVFGFDPDGDRISFDDEDDWALNPLFREAIPSYHYSSGDTIRINLPDGRLVSLIEVKVEPRFSDFELIAGSLWIEEESGALARAAYRPARPFDMDLDDPGEAEDVPGFVKPIVGEIDFVVVEYSLYDLTWWLPARFAFQGEARVGGFIAAPITVEWSLSQYEVNPEQISLPETGPLPEGWSRHRELQTEEGEEEIYVTVLVPSMEEIFTFPELSPSLPGPEPLVFSQSEIDQFQSDLNELTTIRPPRLRTIYGLQDGMIRYNRVEALSVGARQEIPLGGRVAFEAMGRIGIGDFQPSVELDLRRGTFDHGLSFGIYRRLDHSSDWDDPFDFSSNISNLLLGNDRGQYFRSTGTELRWNRKGRMIQGGVRLFYEDHNGVRKETDFHLHDVIGGQPMIPVIHADDGRIGGASGSFRWQWGLEKVVASGRVTGEIAGGDFRYRRALASTALSFPLPFGLAGGLEVQAGSTWGNPPIQKNFYLGGSSTLRGFKANSLMGESFWAARTEVATAFPVARLSLFSDWAWAGNRREFPSMGGPRGSVGTGLSFFEGLIRLDFARAIRNGDSWDLLLYFDGIL